MLKHCWIAIFLQRNVTSGLMEERPFLRHCALMNTFLYGVQSRIQVAYWFYGSQAQIYI